MIRRHVAALVAALSLTLGAHPPVAEAQTAVIVHRASTVSNVGAEDLRRFFLGKSTIAGNGQQIVLVELTPIRAHFYKSLLGLTADEVRRRWIAMVFRGDALALPFEMPDAAAVKKFVAEHPGAIAFIPASEIDETIKVVRIDGKLPSEAGYPIK
ncbi:MAG TPA: hypothetical protein VHM30_12405 [Gemmatimonadaceae bacterium]|nr:hypothetical protein [Gemmatimonadaceae bacterium]